jgi:outer membrane immunogenic protein
MMRFNRKAGVAALLTAAAAAPSFAADMPRRAYREPIPYVAPFVWAGFYVGINGGFGWGDSEASGAAGAFTTGTQDGWLVGGTLGYNFQAGYWVWGVEGDIAWSSIKGNAANVAVCPGGCSFKDTYFGTIRGRIGYGFERWLPYVTAGGAFGGVKVEPVGMGSSTSGSFGWTVGAGVEYAFLGNWSAKLEYLYADLGKSTCSAAVCGADTDVEPTLSLVRVGLNYRF